MLSKRGEQGSSDRSLGAFKIGITVTEVILHPRAVSPCEGLQSDSRATDHRFDCPHTTGSRETQCSGEPSTVMGASQLQESH